MLARLNDQWAPVGKRYLNSASAIRPFFLANWRS